MRWAQLRGVLAFVAVVVSIVFAWTSIENRVDEATASGPVTTTSSASSTTSSLSPTLSTTPLQARRALCERSERFAAEGALVPADFGPGPLATLALQFWRDVEDVSTPDLAVELVAVIDYYESYMTVAQPFEFDASKIILEGDKEKFEQLVTRPAPGLEAMRAEILLRCEVEIPDQPRIGARALNDLEDRLLDPPGS